MQLASAAKLQRLESVCRICHTRQSCPQRKQYCANPNNKTEPEKAGNKADGESLADRIEEFLMPQEEGDMKDWAWMGISIGVLVFFSANLFRVYSHLYYAAGLQTIADIIYK